MTSNDERRPRRRALVALLGLAAAALTGCSDFAAEADAPGRTDADAPQEAVVALAVAEAEWDAQGVPATTRSGETLRGLQASEEGFGLYSRRLDMQNRRVTWDATAGRWDYGDRMLWPENKVKSRVTFGLTESDKPGPIQNKAGYYSVTDGAGYAAVADGCTYDGLTFTYALELTSETTTISWTSGERITVTIVQRMAGETDAIRFDGEKLAVTGSGRLSSWTSELHTQHEPVYYVEEIDGCRVYTILNVGPSEHSITRGNGEPGILCVSVEVDVFAYAPYDDEAQASLKDVSIRFACLPENKTDLLWAQTKVHSSGIIDLDFRHALARLTLGSVVNTFGSNIRLMSVSVTGTFYTEGLLSLADGTWTLEADNKEHTYWKEYVTTVTAETEESAGTAPETRTELGVEIKNGDAILFGFDEEIMQIPPEKAVTVTIVIGTDYGTKTIVKEVTLEQGVNKEINLTIDQNHEVVIQ